MELKIYDKDNALRMEAACEESSSQQVTLHGDNILSLSFTSYECISIDVNDYVDFCGERFWAVERYIPKQESTVEWKYTLKLYGIQSLVSRFLAVKLVDGEYETEFSLTAPASGHLQLIVDSINAGMGTTDWKAGECVQSENLVIDYTGTYCNEGLSKLAESAGTEFWFDGTTVNLCRCERGEPVTLSYNNGLVSLYREAADNVKFFTRLFPVGSTRNIDPEKYGHTRLQLPDGEKYVDRDIDKYGIIHHYEKEAFSGIYPRRVGTVSSVRSSDAVSEDGTEYKIYWFKDSGLDFNPNSYEIAGLVKHVSFQSGELSGRDFEVNWHPDTEEFEIITTWPYDDGRQVPGDTLIPASGDKYILWNLRMPDEYYALAEQEFLDAVNTYMDDNRKDVSVYKGHTDYIDIDERGLTLVLGQRIRLESTQQFPETGYKLSRIVKITRNVLRPADMDIEISDVVSKGKYDVLDDSVDEIKSFVETSAGALPGIVKSWEGTKLTDSNLMSSAKTLLEMARRSISKVYDDIVSGVITFLKRPVAAIGMEFGKFQSGQPGAGGAVMIDQDGNSKAEVDYISVRKAAQFNRLVIQDIKHAGGRIILSPASMLCSRVEETDDAYRCYFETEDSYGHSVHNQFVAGDQAIRQTFNTNESRYYWRLVAAVGDNWIDLSKTDCDTGSGVPEKGDEIVQLGNRTDASRQSVQMLSSFGDGAPSYEVFNWIDSYTLAGKDIAGIVYNPNSNQPQVYCFGEMYVGDRDPDSDGATFMTFQRKEGESKKKVYIQGGVSIGTGSSGLENLSEWAGKQDEINAAQDSANNAQSTANSALQKAQDANDYIDNTLPGEIAELNAKIDGVVENWFYDYTPARSNEPAATWIADGTEKDHVGDTFTNTQEYVDDETTPDAGKSWRWVASGDSYTWTPIADSDAVKALQQAAKAQDTADEKRRVFIATPYTPYDVGDMWMQGPSGEIMRCIKARQTGSYTASDWDRASKYTDDTAVNNLQIGVVNLIKNSKLDDYTGWHRNGDNVEVVTFDGFQCLKATGSSAGFWTRENTTNVPVSCQLTHSVDLYATAPCNIFVGVEYKKEQYIQYIAETGKWIRFYYTQEVDEIEHAYVIYNESSDATVYFKNVKCEAGNKATSWSLATEDVDGAINEVSEVASSALDRVTLHDTRTANESPQWYIENYPRQSVQEFKLCSVIGLPAGAGADAYCYVVTDIIWDDSSGGWPRQTAKTNDGKQYWRAGTSATTWGEWKDAYGTAQDALQNKTVTTIDATGLDAEKYYPVTMKIDDQHRTYIDVSSGLGLSAVPPWATHANGFTCKGRWSAYGNGWGNTKISRIVDVFQFDYTQGGVPPFGTVGQLEYSSEEYVYVRGGGKYEFTVWGGDEPVTPVLRSSNYTSGAGQSLEAGIASVTVPQTVDARISDLDYLKDTFGYVVDVNGVVLGKLVAVKDEAGNVRAMLNGSDLGKDTSADEKGKLLLATGMTDIQNPSSAKTKVYEGGLLETLLLRAQGGQIGGFYINSGKLAAGTEKTEVEISPDFYYLADNHKYLLYLKGLNLTKSDAGEGAMFVSFEDPFNPEEEFAINCPSGMYGGFRPATRVLERSEGLSKRDNVVIAYGNNKHISIGLPSGDNAKNGQCYMIIADGSNSRDVHADRNIVWLGVQSGTKQELGSGDMRIIHLIFSATANVWYMWTSNPAG